MKEHKKFGHTNRYEKKRLKENKSTDGGCGNEGVDSVRRSWTNKEIKYLLDNYYDVPNKVLAEKLGRSEGAIRNAHAKYRPKNEKREKLDIYAYYKGDELVLIGTAKEIAEYLNVKVSTIYWYHCRPEFLKSRRVIKVEKIRGSGEKSNG